MADLTAGEPFGLDSATLKTINWRLGLERIIHNLRSDFIYAPHIGFIYRRAGAHLIADLVQTLGAGTYRPGAPITIEVPKSYRIRVLGLSRRLGPAYSRPGSILLPSDRLFYQVLADQAAPTIDRKTDYTRSFSHKLAEPKSAAMFLPTRTCWTSLQNALTKHAEHPELKYVMKVDVANYFGSLNIHKLVNVLTDAGYPTELAHRLDAILTSYTGERSSRGILQGIYPSDMLGNYYLAPLDRFLSEIGVSSARYVDDIYIFLNNAKQSDRLLHQLIVFLRSYDLSLNEAKSIIMPKLSLKTEEPDLEALFDHAVAEIMDQIDDEEFDADYGFQTEWNDQEPEEDLELKATKLLFDAIDNFPGQEENIERFCLPLFSRDSSDYAVQHVIDSFMKRPAMAQIYCSYLSKFVNDGDIIEFLTPLLASRELFDWQKMWVLACLLRGESSDATVSAAWQLAKATDVHMAVRAIAAIYVGEFGDHARRQELRSLYASVPPYVQTAIFYSSRNWPSAERNTAKGSWGTHGELQVLLKKALSAKA